MNNFNSNGALFDRTGLILMFILTVIRVILSI